MCESPLQIRFVRIVVILFAVVINGCTSMYFHTLDEVPTVEPHHPSAWPWQEYWTGIIFNGEKIGFSHQQFLPDQHRFLISSEAALRLRFLVVDKQFAAVTHDWVDASLNLQNLDYEYKIDKSRRLIKGSVYNNQLVLEVSDGEHTDTKELKFDGELVPLNAIYLYPVVHGLQVGRQYNYQVFDGESLAIQPVEQTIVAYQSSKLFDEKAFRVETEMMGLTTTTWLDASGLPQFELSLRGTLISALEPEKYAKEYITKAALAKSDHLISYSLIPVTNTIEDPRNLQSLSIRLSGIPETFELHDTSMQQCLQENSTWLCRIQTDAATGTTVQTSSAATTAHDVLPSFTVNSTAQAIIELGNEIAATATEAEDQVQRILAWMNENIEKDYIDSFNALDVLRQRKAECQGHSLLFAALARSLDIPTRLLNGVVYAEEYDAFLYHTWVESYIDNRWQAIDPTFGQRHADATHIALIEGEETAELTALLTIIGVLQIEVE